MADGSAEVITHIVYPAKKGVTLSLSERSYLLLNGVRVAIYRATDCMANGSPGAIMSQEVVCEH